MSKALKIVAAIVIIIAISAIIQKVVSGRAKASANKELTNLANDMNAKLPTKIDPSTTLTRVDFDGKTWRVNYTMDKGAAIDPLQKDKYESYAVTQICGSNMKAILKQNITIEYLYTYTDAGGERQLRISIPPNKCS